MLEHRQAPADGTVCVSLTHTSHKAESGCLSAMGVCQRGTAIIVVKNKMAVPLETSKATQEAFEQVRHVKAKLHMN